MSDDRHFLDTNIFVYSFDLQAPAKAKRAENLIADALTTGAGMISFQVAHEFVAVARKLFRTSLDLDQIERYWDATLRPLLSVHSSPGLFVRALDLVRRDRLSWYDALIVSAALQGQCKILYSEDLPRGRHFGDLVVENPFL